MSSLYIHSIAFSVQFLPPVPCPFCVGTHVTVFVVPLSIVCVCVVRRRAPENIPCSIISQGCQGEMYITQYDIKAFKDKDLFFLHIYFHFIFFKLSG